MTYALLLLWTATAQTADRSTAAPATAPAIVVQCASSGDDRTLRAQLDEVRAQLTTAKEESRMPDHAVATLLVSDHPELTSLWRTNKRHADRGIHKATIDVFVSPRPDETMVAVVVNLKNPRDEKTWEPKEAWIKTPFAPKTMAAFDLPVRWLPPTPAAVRSVPQRILPGQSARIAVVFDRTDVDLAGGPVVIELLRDGEWEFEVELKSSDLLAMSKGGSAQ